ncbi:hypothetical protein GCM10009780_24970 [Actinomadura alba]
MHGPGVCPPLMRQGTYAVDPEPFGPPWLQLDDEESVLIHGRPGGRGSAGPRDTYVLAPGDVQNTRLILEKCETGCWGLNGGAGPNLACVSCGAEVGTRTDDCQNWQEARLDPAAVGVADEDSHRASATVPFWWDTAEAERLGNAPLDDRGDLDWRWIGEFVTCTATVLARSGGGPIFVADGPAAPIRDLLTATLQGTGHARALRRLPRVDSRHAGQWRVAAATVGVTPASVTSVGRSAVICDLVGPGEPFTTAAGLLNDWCAQELTEPHELNLIGVIPQHDIGSDARPELAHATRDRSMPIAEYVPLAAHVWSYLAHDQTQSIRALSRTHWGHNGLAAMVHRDEPTHHGLGMEITGYARWFGRHDVLTCLVKQPEARRPWLRGLIGEIRAQP